jgi:sensor histidine kinase regulating citrate/malate metabolism
MAFVNILFIGVIVFLFYTFARQLEQESVEKTENVYLENIDHLVISLRSQRHDYLNHFQVISELVHQQAYDALNQYLKDLNIEIKNNDSLLQLNHVPLAALLKAKMEIAQVNQIRMEVDIQTSIPKLDIKPYELVQMLGNLIDNAIDEEIKAPPSERFIKVAIHTMFDSLLTILVHNKNSWIQPETVKYLFQEGYTTKKDHRGIGLAAVKRVITKYGGHVEVESSEQEGTTFFLFITYSSR